MFNRADAAAGPATRGIAGVALAVLAWAGCTPLRAAEDLPTPTIFAPGVVSAGANDGAPTFTPDGRTLYFERTNSKWTIILESHLTANGWSKPRVADFSGTFGDQQPALSPDGTYLIYASIRPVTAADGTKRGVSHLYRVSRVGNGWSEPVELPTEVNISDRVFKPSIAANGDLYFMSDTATTGNRQWRLFHAAREGGGYTRARALDFSVIGDVDPYVAPDGSYLIFSSNSRSTEGDSHEHLYFARRSGAGWSAVAPLRYDGDTWGADDGEAQVSPDGRTLYFTSSRVLPLPAQRNHAAAVAALARIDQWDNSNGNAWSIPLRLPAV